MNRLLMYSVSHHAEDEPVIIFVPSRKISREIAKDLITRMLIVLLFHLAIIEFIHLII
jgi:hypothetical protein